MMAFQLALVHGSVIHRYKGYFFGFVFRPSQIQLQQSART
jgi:hypothetical protein